MNAGGRVIHKKKGASKKPKAWILIIPQDAYPEEDTQKRRITERRRQIKNRKLRDGKMMFQGEPPWGKSHSAILRRKWG